MCLNNSISFVGLLIARQLDDILELTADKAFSSNMPHKISPGGLKSKMEGLCQINSNSGLQLESHLSECDICGSVDWFCGLKRPQNWILGQ